jgi:hypothetical protein
LQNPDKFQEGEHLINKLSNIFKQNEAFTSEVISKYRAFIEDFETDVQNLSLFKLVNQSYAALAALSYSIIVL